jgi:DNA-binding MarR family transcriptional regulator
MPRRAKTPADDSLQISQGPELTFQELDGLLGYRLRRAQGAMHRDYMAAVADLNLTQKQTAALWLIGANPGVSQVTVAAALGMDRATMMAVVDKLQDRGLTLRKRSKMDRRRQELLLTVTGQRMLKTVKARIAEHEARFTARFKPAELAALLGALQRIRDVD